MTLLQEAGASGGGWEMILLMVAFFAILYFMMIRPQQKRQKEIRKQREAMKVGDNVVTAGGIHGTIKEVNPNYLLIEIADGVKIRVLKDSVYPSVEAMAQNQQK